MQLVTVTQAAVMWRLKWASSRIFSKYTTPLRWPNKKFKGHKSGDLVGQSCDPSAPVQWHGNCWYNHSRRGTS